MALRGHHYSLPRTGAKQRSLAMVQQSIGKTGNCRLAAISQVSLLSWHALSKYGRCSLFPFGNSLMPQIGQAESSRVGGTWSETPAEFHLQPISVFRPCGGLAR